MSESCALDAMFFIHPFISGVILANTDWLFPVVKAALKTAITAILKDQNYRQQSKLKLRLIPSVFFKVEGRP